MGAKIIFAVIFAVLAVVVYLETQKIFQVPPKPDLEEIWWGPGDPTKADTAIRPFTINIPDEVIEDLNKRLSNALPFQAPLQGAKQHYGINTNHLKNIVEFWKKDYKWRERETFLNKYPQFKTNIQGLNIHYIHVKPKQTTGVKVLPLLLLHGWPGSIREFYEIIPLLTTPQKGRKFVFEVIVPSLPGYGFSDGAVKPGLSPIHMTVIFKNLMERIGFEKYYIHGGDWGAIIVQHMAVLFPDKVIGVHSNACVVNTPLSTIKLFIGSIFPSFVIDSADEVEKMYPLSEFFSNLLLEFGYLHLQATKPDTIGVALRESPVGLAAYILEKFTTWTNPAWKDLDDGGLTKKYTYTNLLDNVMIYWVSKSITTSMRLYSENFNKANLSAGIDNDVSNCGGRHKIPAGSPYGESTGSQCGESTGSPYGDRCTKALGPVRCVAQYSGIPVEIPSGCARFRYELVYQPNAILKEKYPNLVHAVNYDEGGHFAAFEVPDLLAKDVYDFVEKVETPKKKTP